MIDDAQASSSEHSDSAPQASEPQFEVAETGGVESQDPNVAPDHSAEQRDFQGQPADDFAAKLAKRVARVDEAMADKEELVLSYVFSPVPRSFYLRWKRESNDIFSLRVRLKRRPLEAARNLRGKAQAVVQSSAQGNKA